MVEHPTREIRINEKSETHRVFVINEAPTVLAGFVSGVPKY